MLFWLCKGYYRSVHADMMRDAHDHNAECYGELKKGYRPFIKNDNHICIINECLEYIEDEYHASPCEETAEKLVEAYSNIMYYYEKRLDSVNYPKNALSYLSIKTEQFRSDPDVMEGFDIVWCCYASGQADA